MNSPQNISFGFIKVHKAALFFITIVSDCPVHFCLLLFWKSTLEYWRLKSRKLQVSQSPAAESDSSEGLALHHQSPCSLFWPVCVERSLPINLHFKKGSAEVMGKAA